MLIAHSQGLAAFALHVIPPALKIHRPDLIGCLSVLSPPAAIERRRRARRSSQSCALQDALEAAFTGRLTLLAQIQLPNLSGTPMPMRLLQPNDFAYLHLSQLISMRMRPPRLFSHPLDPLFQKSPGPFIPGLGADTVLRTQTPKVVCSHRFHCKFNPQIHRFPLCPRHCQAYGQAKPSQKCYLCSEPNLLPMF